MAVATDEASLGRRALLRLGAAGVVVLPFSPFAALAAAAPRRATAGAGRRLALVLSSTGSAGTLASRLRCRLGATAAVERELAAELARLRSLAAAPLSAAELAARIRRGIETDFAAGRTMRLDGWVLSRTELALCHAVAAPPPDGAATT